MSQQAVPATHTALPPVLGLTGGIAAGKSTVSAMLARLGAHIIDADSFGHAVIAPEGSAFRAVVEEFGQDILDEDGSVNRGRLGAIVFSDPERLSRLNALVHPAMEQAMEREILRLRKEHARSKGALPTPLIVVDAAILLEAGWDRLCGLIWVVEIGQPTAIARLMARNGLSREAAKARLGAQLDPASRRKRAAAVLTNEGSLAELEQQVEQAWRTLMTDLAKR